MRHPRLRSLFCAVVIAITAVISGCEDRLEEGPSEEEIFKAMHDDLSVSHSVADFMVKDHEGIDLLAERLTKDPAAAGRLFEAMARKGGGEKVIALACLRAEEWERRNAAPVASSTTTGAQELQTQPAGGTQ